jgi:Protein of unknown function (DUF3421)
MFYVSDDEERFATASIEYMISNPKHSYNWMRSSDGSSVQHALVLQEVDNWPFYWGKFEDDGQVYVGKVLPHMGLQYADQNGVVKVTRHYDVLTCTSTSPPVNFCTKF